MIDNPALVLYSHPLASFCHKVLIALYENATPFQAVTVDLGDPEDRARHLARWPVAKIPLLEDRGQIVAETSIIIEHLQRRHPGPAPMIPGDPDAALEVRLWDRFFDLYVSQPVQKIVIDRLRPEGQSDPTGVAEARATLRTAYAMIDDRMRARDWAAGTGFSMADCAAAPALFYAETLEPLADHQALAAYYERLMGRPSFARVLVEARPWFDYYPYREAIAPRFL